MTNINLDLDSAWWYYTVEKSPGIYYDGIVPHDCVLLPRKNLSKIDLDGMKTLDVCTMEGLMPTIMCKSGASEVHATDSARPTGYPDDAPDSLPTNLIKMEEIKRLHGVDFTYSVIPEKTSVFEHLSKSSQNQFDLVNLSGLLYHVFSPMHWIGSIRPLVKNGGFAIISTNVSFDGSHTMVFNSKGGLQTNLTTYWYISVPLFDYLLRYFRLRPLRAEYSMYDDGNGYMSVVCRAEENVIRDSDDEWMEPSAWHSWDSKWFGGLEMTATAQQSLISFKDKQIFSTDQNCIHGSGPDERLSLEQFVNYTQQTPHLGATEHTVVLRLDDIE